MKQASDKNSEVAYTAGSHCFLFLSSVLSAVVTGLLAYIILAKLWTTFGILQPHAEGLSLGVCLITPIYYKIHKRNLVNKALNFKTQFQRVVIHLLCVSFALVLVLNLDLVVSFLYNFSNSLISSLK